MQYLLKKVIDSSREMKQEIMIVYLEIRGTYCYHKIFIKREELQFWKKKKRFFKKKNFSGEKGKGSIQKNDWRDKVEVCMCGASYIIRVVVS